eukprot:3704014-Rhodomonas_salina.1
MGQGWGDSVPDDSSYDLIALTIALGVRFEDVNACQLLLWRQGAMGDHEHPGCHRRSHPLLSRKLLQPKILQSL